MLQVDIILNGGGRGIVVRCIQRIVIWNTSELAELSDYEYAVSEPTPMGRTTPGQPDGVDLARGYVRAQHRGTIEMHDRSLPPTALLQRVLEDLESD